MPEEIAIEVRNLTKTYKLYNSPMDRLREALHPLRKKYHHDFFALKDVTFDVNKGETVGIIGRNGSGKSTLLKMITGVLTPTSGNVSVRGKVSALLELGAGFNPELTGIQNVYFNGTLMGYTREEMETKIDSILSFADIGEFVNQPVKVYSSGMFVRLAFAVAINVEPEILIIDEALSVGDVKFQRKCYSKIDEFRNNQNTILFVSHDLGAVSNLCDTAILIDNGKLYLRDVPRVVTKSYFELVYDDPLSELFKNTVGPAYVKEEVGGAGKDDSENNNFKQKVIREIGSTNIASTCELRHGNGKAEIVDFGIMDCHQSKINYLKGGGTYTFYFYLIFYFDIQNLFGCFAIRNSKGVDIFYTNTDLLHVKISNCKRHSLVSVSLNVTNALAPGDYFLSCIALDNASGEYLDRRLDVFHFRVDSYNVYSRGFVDLKPELQWCEIALH